MILVVRHKAEIGLGHLTPVLDELGLSYRYIDPFMDQWQAESDDWVADAESDEVRGLVILGGPQNADDPDPYLNAERDLIRRRVLADKPTFGICLGSQLIARALGAPAYQKLYPETGWTPIFLTEAGKNDPVMAALGDGTPQIQYHNDSFDRPAGSVLLAYSMTCPHQAYRIGQRVYAVQFHPEADLPTIQDWFGPKNTDEPDGPLIMAETVATYEERRERSLAMFRTYCQAHFLAG